MNSILISVNATVRSHGYDTTTVRVSYVFCVKALHAYIRERHHCDNKQSCDADVVHPLRDGQRTMNVINSLRRSHSVENTGRTTDERRTDVGNQHISGR